MSGLRPLCSKRSLTFMANTLSSKALISKSRLVTGICCVFALLSLGLMCLWVIAQSGLSTAGLGDIFANRYYQHVMFITIKQAGLSVLCASVIGVFAAITFHRRPHLIFRKWILIGCFSAMIMPTTVASLALLKLWGQSGLIAQTPLHTFLPEKLGLWSVILAHSFFNAPLVMRVCLAALESVPQAQTQQAALLRLSPFEYFKIIDWPAIRQVLPSVMGLVFLLCATSFALILMLGGGPSVTTLEVSIYTALRFEFNLPKAALLSVIQLVLCVGVLWLFKLTRQHHSPVLSMPTTSVIRADTHHLSVRVIDGLMTTIIIILNIIPLLLLLIDSDIVAGFPLLSESRFYHAFFNSLTLAIGSALFALILSIILSFLAYEIKLRAYPVIPHLIELTHSLFLIIPALVFGTSIFILLRAYIDVTAYGFWILLLGNSLLALPFCYRIIGPALVKHLEDTAHLSALLRLSTPYRLFYIIGPTLKVEIGFALGLSAALSFGDLGIITLFGSQDFETLPYLLFQFLNRYGADEADLLALILLLSAVGLYGLFTKLVELWGNKISR